MKKKILALVVTLVMMFTMVGCNTEGLALIDQLEKVASWEAMDMKGEAGINFVAGDETMKVNMDYTAYSITEDLQMEMTLNIKSIEVAGATIDLTKGEFKLSPITLYMDGMKFYISTDWMKELCQTALGLDASTMSALSKEYIALDMTSFMEQAGMSMDEITQMSVESMDMFKDSKLDVPVTKKDNTYTIELKDAQMVDLLFDFYVEMFDSQKDIFVTQYKAMGLTDEQIAEVFAQLKTMFGPETKALVKPMLAGSSAKAAYTFEEESYSADIAAAIKFTVDQQTIEMGVTEKTKVNKVAKKEIAFPTSVAAYTMEDLMAMAMSSQVVEVAAKDCIVEKDVTYVPLKTTLAKVGLNVGYDSATKTVYIKELGNMPVECLIKKGVSYISLEQLAELGLICEITQ